jgi:uncharacterized protein (TIGR03067 family)
MAGAKKTSDLDALQGTWSVSTLELNGEAMHAVPPDACITVKGTKFTTSGMGADYRGEMSLDDAAKPKAFDLKFTTGPEKGNLALGIYELDSDQWKMCLTTQGGNRPKKFATKAGTGWALQTLVRGKTVAKARTAKSKPAAAPEGEPAPELDGEWSIKQLVMDGKPLEEGMLSWGKRITKDGETKVLMGPQTVLHVRFAVDRARSPMWMNYIHAKSGAMQLGIYKVEGNTLTTCMAKAGAPRPDKFESPKGSGRTLGVWLK